MASQSKSSCFRPYLVFALQTQLLNSHRVGLVYFKDCLTVSSDSDFFEGFRTAKQEEEGEMGIFYNLSEK